MDKPEQHHPNCFTCSQKIGRMESKVETFDVLPKQLSEMNDKLTAILQQTTATNGRVTTLESRMKANTEADEIVASRVRALEESKWKLVGITIAVGGFFSFSGTILGAVAGALVTVFLR